MTGREEFEARIEETVTRLRENCAEELAPYKNITLEIGCGHGHYLTAYAQENTDEVCVGIDLVTKRVEKSTAKKEKRDLEQLKFMKAEAIQFLEILPEHIQLDKTFLLFPDPWPKKRHFKNRLVQSSFLELLASKTVENGMFYYRTDHEGYFEWSVEMIAKDPNWEILEEEEWPFEAPSFFQDLMSSWNSLIARKVSVTKEAKE